MGLWPTKGKDKLYKQWAEHSGLPPEAIPQREEAKEAPVRAGKDEQHFRVPAGGGGERRLLILYILLGAAIMILCVGVIILLMQVG
jgi:hypothetical protein